MRSFLLSFSLGLFLGSGLTARALADPPAVAPGPAVSEKDAEFFESKVRPILVESCARCHGTTKQGSGLRLDSREAMMEGGESGPALVPGDPDKSLLVQAIRYSHDDVKMPPKAKLPDLAVATLETWVKQGAPWPGGKTLTPEARDKAGETHWAFRPVREVTAPSVGDASWGSSPIDAFVLSALEKKGMVPQPRADKRTLIRRATFDLTGLPPTIEEIEAFEADPRSDAFARVVDRLLASPRYGERWGRHWLDVARYADTKGYVFTEERRYPFSYTYRDYVIRAFNEDKPYNQFLLEQVAADLLPPGGDPNALAALGFLTVGRRFLNDGNDIIDDRIDVVTRGLLGLTVTCARCHDHKYDPIPTDDYYSLHGVFASSVEPGELPLLKSSATDVQAMDYDRQYKAIEAEFRAFVASKQAEIQDDLRGRITAYLKVAAQLGFDRDNPKRNELAAAERLDPARLRWLIRNWETYRGKTRAQFDPIFAPWNALADLPAAEFSSKAKATIETLAESKPPVHPLVVRALRSAPLERHSDVALRYAALFGEAESKWRERLKAGAVTALADPDWESLRQVLYRPDGPVTLTPDLTPGPFPNLARNAGRLYSPGDRKKLEELKNRATQLMATHPGPPARAMVLNDAPQPVNPYVFLRGNPGRRGKDVPRQFLKVLSGPDRKPFQKGSGRLELAKAIVDPSNPMTARVLVNRVWLQHFGMGLVATPSDFGLRSEPPSHPELLDFLTGHFLRDGWSIKSLHRRIMLSSVYQQGSENQAAYLERDPENRLLWKYPRRRLDFESMRDAMLAVSARLDETIGGRPVPIGEPPFSPRRTVYGFIDRQNLDGVYRTFDFASPDASSPRRFVTTVPQQALFLMNSPFVIERAKELGASVQATPSPEARVQAYYERLFGRMPESHEVELGLRFVDHQSTLAAKPPQLWQFGYGGVDESSGRLAGFTPFPFWTGNTWQCGPKIPDPNLHFLNLNAGGGHVGNDASHAAIRRWTAPHDAVIVVEASLEHGSPNGDGVRGRIVASKGGELGSWVAHNAKVRTHVARYAVRAGETVDFAVDCRTSPDFDSFAWSPVIREISPETSEWAATAGFEGPAPPVLTPWEAYAQVLLLTNEFMFVD